MFDLDIIIAYAVRNKASKYMYRGYVKIRALPAEAVFLVNTRHFRNALGSEVTIIRFSQFSGHKMLIHFHKFYTLAQLSHKLLYLLKKCILD